MSDLPSGYDAWRLASPDDERPDPCECGEEDCTCAEDAELDRGDWLYERMRDDQMERP